MADERVTIPIELSVTDIRTGDVDLKDVQKSVQEKLSNIAKTAGDVLGEIDTSKLNKSLTSSMDKVIGSYQKLATEKSKLDDVLKSAGSTSPVYKAQFKEIQAEIDKTKRNWEQLSDLMFSTPVLGKAIDDVEFGRPVTEAGRNAILMYEKEYARYDAKMAELTSRIPDPKSFIDTATTTELQKIVTAYYNIFNAVNKVESATINWQETAAKNPMTDDYTKKLNELSTYESKLERVQEKAQKMSEVGAGDKAWKGLHYDATILEEKIQAIIEDLRTMVEEGSAFRFGTGDITAELDALDERLNRTTEIMNELPGAPVKAKAGFKDLAKTIGNFIQSASKGFSNIISNMKKLGQTTNSTSKQMQKSFKKLWKDILMFGFGVRSTFFLVRRLRNVFIDSFKEMAKQIPEVNDNISAFVKSLNQIKGSVATTFQPLASVVIPWFNQFIALMNDAMNTVARFFATLTGQGYIYKFTAAQVDYAESLDKTSKSAKNAQKSLMGFDEINRLNADPDTGSGEVPTGTWEKEMLDGMSSLAEMIKKAWAKNDFTEVGNYIGTNLLNALQTANNWITTKGFAYASNIGNSLATLINGALAVDSLGIQLGTTLANIFNMALTGINKFLTTTNWLNLGQFIADWANGTITTFNWSLLGQTIGKLITASVNTWWKFLGEFDFSELGTGISTALNNLFRNVLTIDETGLTSAQKLGQTITNVINGILTTLTTAIETTDWSSIGQAIGEILQSIDWSAIVWNFDKLVGEVIQAIGTAFSNWSKTDPISAGIAILLASIFGAIKIAPFIIGLTKLLTSESFTTAFSGLGDKLSSIGSSIGTAFSSLLTKLEPVFTAISNFGANVVQVFKLVVGGAGTLREAMITVFGKMATNVTGVTSIITGVIIAVSNFFDMLKNGFSWVKEILMVVGIALAAVGAVIMGAPVLVAGVIAGIVAAVATLVVLVKEHWNEICSFVSKLWTDMTTSVANVWNGLTTSIKNGLAAISNWWTNTWSAIKNYVVTTWANIKTTVSNTFNTIKANISTTITNIKTVWTNGWTSVKTAVVNIWNGIWGFIKGIINSIIGGINGMIKGIVGGINSIIGVLNKLNIDIPDWIPELGGKTFGFNLQTVTAPQIPMLAKGGVIPPNQEFMAILGDQKHGTNIEAPLDTIKQAVAEELSEYIDAMMTGFQAVVDAVNNKDLDVRIGDTAIGKAAERYSKRQALVRGTV